MSTLTKRSKKKLTGGEKVALGVAALGAVGLGVAIYMAISAKSAAASDGMFQFEAGKKYIIKSHFDPLGEGGTTITDLSQWQSSLDGVVPGEFKVLSAVISPKDNTEIDVTVQAMQDTSAKTGSTWTIEEV